MNSISEMPTITRVQGVDYEDIEFGPFSETRSQGISLYRGRAYRLTSPSGRFDQPSLISLAIKELMHNAEFLR